MAGIFQPDDVLAGIASSGEKPRLLLHCCCAPCSSYVLEYLLPYFRITALFFNPNIKPREEYDKRAAEMERLLSLEGYRDVAGLLVAGYDVSCFDSAAAPFLEEPEGGERCRVCFELRLGETARHAGLEGFDYFSTTLSVSPHKDAAALNEIGARLAGECGVMYLHSDYKKRGGFARSVELSKEFGLYRQGYCGCVVEF